MVRGATTGVLKEGLVITADGALTNEEFWACTELDSAIYGPEVFDAVLKWVDLQ